MYSVPPVQPPEPVHWPRTLLLPPRRRPSDRHALAMRLVFVAIQAAGFWGSGARSSLWAILGCLWLALLLGPTADLLPATWQRPASILRISQFLLCAGVAVAYVAQLVIIIR